MAETGSIRLGIAGSGVAASQVIPNIRRIPEVVRITAVADRRPGALEQFRREDPEVATFSDVAEMCAWDGIDAVWVSTPNEFHAEHAIVAARHGKHVICEKPMATTLEECLAIEDAARRSGVLYVQGHSKVYDAPVHLMRQVLKSGELGRVVQIDSWNFNDWVIRPFTPLDLETARGAGLVYRQAPHQVDMVRYLAGGVVRSVRSRTGRWDEHLKMTESNYTAFLNFEHGVAASISFNGLGHFDITDLTWGIGEGGWKRRNSDSTQPRSRPTGPMDPERKYALLAAGDPFGYGADAGIDRSEPRRQPFFGLTLVTCERGVIRQSPDGLYLYGSWGRREVPCGPSHGRGASELLELHRAIRERRQPFLDARWGTATLEVCTAILTSSREDREVYLSHQVPIQDIPGW